MIEKGLDAQYAYSFSSITRNIESKKSNFCNSNPNNDIV